MPSTATETQARDGWSKIHSELAAFSKRVGRDICFTELGYSASSRAGSHPWEHHEVDPDRDYQAMLYRVAFEEVEKNDAVVGVFLWKWFTGDLETARRHEGRDVFGLQAREQTLQVLRNRWGESATSENSE